MAQSSASIASEEERNDDVPEAGVSADNCLYNDPINRVTKPYSYPQAAPGNLRDNDARPLSPAP